MTEKEEIILETVLTFLCGCEKPQSEPMIHSAAQTKLGVKITVNELEAVLQLANQKNFAIGLPASNDKLRWSISDTGRHHLASK